MAVSVTKKLCFRYIHFHRIRVDDSRSHNKKSCVFGYRFHRIRVDDGVSVTKKLCFSVIVFIVYVWTMAVAVTKKFRFSNENRYVWSGPQSDISPRVATSRSRARKYRRTKKPSAKCSERSAKCGTEPRSASEAKHERRARLLLLAGNRIE